MFPESVKIVFTQYLTQAILALVIMLILRKFFRRYRNDFYLFWSWSWLALTINMFGSCASLANAFILPLEHPLRLIVSAITVSASFLQILWLYSGTLEISRTKKMNRKLIKNISAVIIPISILLVFLNYQDPDAGTYRILYRVGIRSLIGGITFIVCGFLLWRISQTGIGVRFIIFSFLGYGLLQFNYFLEVFLEVNNVNYPLEVPYFMGALDIFLQAVMGLGMIISVLEIEQHNLKKANNELDTFLYRSSHDLRAPLTTISGIVSAIRLTEDANKKEEFLEAIQSRLEQADNVIRDIITLRKGQKMDLQITEVDILKEIITEYDSLTDPNAPHPKLLTQKVGKTIIHTDTARLHTVLTNIFSNSIKYHNYNQENPYVAVDLNKVEDGISIVIRDNGPGIDERHLPKIFDMFYRASKSSNGTGLGLYLVKDALSHLGGKIKVKSEKGIGTTFSIHLKDHGSNNSEI
ncbi:HAMP domain-containing sensor histidine kinase [Ekhidna sp.]|uniref:sensor histidine kinase n=1 Tax=Ekhidna sp. TaxID=2608089 RepID=UPI00329962F9